MGQNLDSMSKTPVLSIIEEEGLSICPVRLPNFTLEATLSSVKLDMYNLLLISDFGAYGIRRVSVVMNYFLGAPATSVLHKK